MATAYSILHKGASGELPILYSKEKNPLSSIKKAGHLPVGGWA
jgi:hypothetical protein